ncbi:hypothetical protein [Sphingomonas astaxanthinifaciens]|uniref:Cytochrome c oxidase cbb3-type subunit 4 n=1 Tax=Sphingomonas astaxanthinifaciens DSM 22298 TaxID=1123267 RepID=A0ABQ5Z9F2_9SPHN|nr:hypothetical protein [Sphingomonas astaxanthinifaciens]GLR48237.1 hypothetical protein GCM10007925_19500 [Sphingomonas astaxanthinifaciens DSM 22298]
MAEGSDVHYWWLVLVGAFVLLGVLFYAFNRNRKSDVPPEVTERATRELYAEEKRAHERDGNSGL